MDKTPEQIAAGLTKAERSLLLRNDNWSVDDAAAEQPSITKALHKKGLTYVMLSPLGEQVRAILQQENTNG